MIFPLRILSVSALFALTPAMLAQQGQPNIIIYMVDDLGWNHISAAAGTMGTAPKIYQTPMIDRLAAEGLSFTNAYAHQNCAPTRAAILSGQYPARIHNDLYVVQSLNRNDKGSYSKDKAKFQGPDQRSDLAPEAVTIAEALQKNGYATAHIGKFHVGGHAGKQTMPENQGFDINLGGGKQGHQPTCFSSMKGNRWVFNGLADGHLDWFAEPYNDDYLAKRKLPESLKGTPKHISDAMGDAMVETIGKLQATKKPFYLQFHTYAVHDPVIARPDLKEAAATRVPGNKKMADYLGFIAGVDENLGRMLAALDDPNGDGDNSDSISNNTLVLFTSDNGGTHASNEPLRGVKGMFTEGGIRVPLIARWPGVVPAGTVTDRMVHSIDFYPTALELAGSKWTPPADEHPLDGESFGKVLRDPKSAKPRGPIFYIFPGYTDSRAQPCALAIDDIEGKRYKLFYFHEADSFELYCLTDDQEEKQNLIETKPEIAKQLSDKLHAWINQEHPTWKPKFPILKSTGEPVLPRKL